MSVNLDGTSTPADWPPYCIDCGQGLAPVRDNPRCVACHRAIAAKHTATFPKPPPAPKTDAQRAFGAWKARIQARGRPADPRGPTTVAALLAGATARPIDGGHQYTLPTGGTVTLYDAAGRIRHYREAVRERQRQDAAIAANKRLEPSAVLAMPRNQSAWSTAIQRDLRGFGLVADTVTVDGSEGAVIVKIGEAWHDGEVLIEALAGGADRAEALHEARLPDDAVFPVADVPSATGAAKVRPLVKWAGGKREYAAQILQLMFAQCPAPDLYVEPFAGGAAVFFALRAALSGVAIGDGSGQVPTPVLTPDRAMPAAVLSDQCVELVDCYRAVAAEPDRVVAAHDRLVAAYSVAWSKGLDAAADWYTALRAKQHAGGLQRAPLANRAAWFLFLNRAGFNGLWRVNRAGNCNVPFGKAAPQKLTPAATIREASVALGETRIDRRDYTEGIEEARAAAAAGRKVVLFMDPPYPGTFDGYSSTGFSLDDHANLAQLADGARSVGATVIVTLPDSPEVRGLYPADRWTAHEVGERRAMNSDAEGRGAVKCLILVGRLLP